MKLNAPSVPNARDPEVEALAREIAEAVWRRMRNYIRRQQRELHDLLEEDS